MTIAPERDYVQIYILYRLTLSLSIWFFSVLGSKYCLQEYRFYFLSSIHVVTVVTRSSMYSVLTQWGYHFDVPATRSPVGVMWSHRMRVLPLWRYHYSVPATISGNSDVESHDDSPPCFTVKAYMCQQCVEYSTLTDSVEV